MQKNHKNDTALCDECQELLAYAHKRLSYCKFGKKRVHVVDALVVAINPQMSKKIKEVMRFSINSEEGLLIQPSKTFDDFDEINGKYFLKVNSSKVINQSFLEDISLLVEKYRYISVYARRLIKSNKGNYLYCLNFEEQYFRCYIEERAPNPLYQSKNKIDYSLVIQKSPDT